MFWASILTSILRGGRFLVGKDVLLSKRSLMLASLLREAM